MFGLRDDGTRIDSGFCIICGVECEWYGKPSIAILCSKHSKIKLRQLYLASMFYERYGITPWDNGK